MELLILLDKPVPGCSLSWMCASGLLLVPKRSEGPVGWRAGVGHCTEITGTAGAMLHVPSNVCGYRQSLES